MKRAFFTILAAISFAGIALADVTIVSDQLKQKSDEFLADFNKSSGYSYVLLKDKDGTETVYRYGRDTRRESQKLGDSAHIMLYSCRWFYRYDLPMDISLLEGALIVHKDDERYAAFQARYHDGCYNPIVHGMTAWRESQDADKK